MDKLGHITVFIIEVVIKAKYDKNKKQLKIELFIDVFVQL